MIIFATQNQILLHRIFQLRQKELGGTGAGETDRSAELRTTYSDLAGIYSALGDHANALDCYRSALEMARTALGEDHPQVGHLYDRIGGVLTAQGGQDAEARESFRRAFQVA